MHSIVQRAQAYFGFLVTVVITMMVAISLSSTVLEQIAPVPEVALNLSTVDVKYGRPQFGYDTRRQEYGFMTFDLEADLTSAFNWNTKQLFVYVAVTYPGRKYKSKSVVWDSIIESKQDAQLSLKNQTAKYAIYDITGKFNGCNGTLSLEWSVQPYVGLLSYSKSPKRTQIVFPLPSRPQKS